MWRRCSPLGFYSTMDTLFFGGYLCSDFCKSSQRCSTKYGIKVLPREMIDFLNICKGTQQAGLQVWSCPHEIIIAAIRVNLKSNIKNTTHENIELMKTNTTLSLDLEGQTNSSLRQSPLLHLIQGQLQPNCCPKIFPCWEITMSNFSK